MDAKNDAARRWFGYGRWEAPYWFIGMEPGGTDDAASYGSWAALGGGELIDCRRHHLHTGFLRWHDDGRRGTQPTWRRLIQTMLAFQGRPTDLGTVLEYQRHKWGCECGDTAVVELGALHAPRLRTKVDRETFRNERIATLHERLAAYRPTFALCYGYGFREQFEEVVGSQFDSNGYTWCGETLCIIAPGPTSFLYKKPTPWAKPEWWIALGKRMREMIDARSGRIMIR